MTQRQDRLADQLQRDLAELIRKDLKDPRIGMVTISQIKLSRDFSYADVYVTVLNTACSDTQINTDNVDVSVARLNAASGFLRNALSKGLSIRVVPRLRFHYDTLLMEAQRISVLIEQTVRSDATE